MTSSGIPTFGGDKCDPVACAPVPGQPLPARPARAATNNASGWQQRYVTAPNSETGASADSLKVERNEV